MSYQTLQQALDSARSPVEMLRNSQIGAYVYPTVPSEFSNARPQPAEVVNAISASPDALADKPSTSSI